MFAILTGILVPISVFVWLYLDAKNKRETLIEISKNLGDPKRLDDLMNLLDDRPKEPIDYRRGGVITLFVGIGLYLMGTTFLGFILKGVGLLAAAIGAGTIIAGYLFPNDSVHLSKAVEKFEEG
ncbi:MAG: DUF6249 domain-containing protein [Luminiphilus sp.]|nr:DUF6249 domain-containing protein [Luminiphilus sp.]